MWPDQREPEAEEEEGRQGCIFWGHEIHVGFVSALNKQPNLSCGLDPIGKNETPLSGVHCGLLTRAQVPSVLAVWPGASALTSLVLTLGAGHRAGWVDAAEEGVPEGTAEGVDWRTKQK